MREKLHFLYNKTNDHAPKVEFDAKSAEKRAKKMVLYLRRTPVYYVLVVLCLYFAQAIHLALDQVHVGMIL